MTSENYRQLLNAEFKSKEMTLEDFDNTLMHFAKLYHEEQTNVSDTTLRSELLLSVICEYNKINTYAEIKKVEEWLEKWDSK